MWSVVCLMFASLYNPADTTHVSYGKFESYAANDDQICTQDIDFIAFARNQALCVAKCISFNTCNDVIYDVNNNTCYGMRGVDGCTQLTNLIGGRYYKGFKGQWVFQPHGETTTTTSATVSTDCPGSFALVSGVAASQLTASSTWGNRDPYHAAFGTGNIWSPFEDNVLEYIQVDLLYQHYVTAIITKGADDMWLTEYTVESSADCSAFYDVLCAFENTLVFPGNTDGSSEVLQLFSTPATARCFRVRPHDWDDWPVLQFELMGCRM